MANVNIWYAKEGVIKLDAAGTHTLSASTVLDTAGTSWTGATTVTGQFKDVSIKEPLGDVEKIDLMGTTSSFQNAEIDELPAGMFEISGTCIVPGDELAEKEWMGAGTAAGGTHTTYQPGLATRTKVQMLLNLDDGTDEVSVAVDNAYLTTSDMKMGASGHLEFNFTLKGLARDYYKQFKD